MTAIRTGPRLQSWADVLVPIGFAGAAALVGLAIAGGKVTHIAIVLGGLLSLVLLQMPAVAMWLVLVGSLAIIGPVAFFIPALDKIPWLFALLTLFLAGASVIYAATMNRSANARMPAFIPLFAAFIAYAAASILWSDGMLNEGASGLKRVAQGTGVMFALATYPFASKNVRRWILLILVISIAHLPIALYQRLELAQVLEGGADAIVGLLELDQRGRGASGVLALMQMLVAGAIVAFARESLLKWPVAVFLIGLVLAPLIFSEVNVIFILAPLVVITAYADLIRKRPMLLVFGLGIFAAGFVMLGSLYLVWQQSAWAGGEQISMERRLENVIAYNFGDRGYNNQGDLNRKTVFTYWADNHGLQNPDEWAFGHGVGSTNLFGDDSVPVLAVRHGGKSLGLSTISQYLWELGIVGTAIFLFAWWSAFTTGLKNLRRSTPGYWRALDRSLIIAIVVLGIGLVYNASLSGILSGQVLAGLVLGLIAWRTRFSEPSR
ncbi:MAG: hypothetical protein M9951_10765 [Burkholderiaceae bacterium]|nr:hypothetical protein [Burkholderiaceae bacterium]MEB2320555.1 hypothetical protein [Pseudomonadota bacterium]